MLAAGPAQLDWGGWLGVLAVALVAVNVVGGFLVTQRMLEMFRKKEPQARLTKHERRRDDAMSANQLALLYLVASVCFIQALKGLSSPRVGAARQRVRHGRHGDRRRWSRWRVIYSHSKNVLAECLGGMVVGGVVGAIVARRVQMTKMPEMVAAMHSLIGLAAVFIAIAAVADPAAMGLQVRR